MESPSAYAAQGIATVSRQNAMGLNRFKTKLRCQVWLREVSSHEGREAFLYSLPVRRTPIRTRLFPKKSAAVRTGECESDTYFSKLWQLYFAGRLCGHFNPLDKDKTRWEKGERCESSHFAERSPWGPVEKEMEVSREVAFQVETATVPPVVPFSFPKVTRHARLRLKVVNIRV